MAFEYGVTPSFFSTRTKSTPYLTSWQARLSPVGRAHVPRRQPAREEDGLARLFDDPAADAPVVRAARAAEFFDGEPLVAGVEQHGVNFRGDAERLFD